MLNPIQKNRQNPCLLITLLSLSFLVPRKIQLTGYPVFSALSPSVGAATTVSVEDDAEHIRNKILIPILGHKERDVIILMHSYSSVVRTPDRADNNIAL